MRVEGSDGTPRFVFAAMFQIGVPQNLMLDW